VWVKNHVHFVSNRALGPGEPHFHAYDGLNGQYLRIEASTDPLLRVPGIPTDFLKDPYVFDMKVKIKIMTYLKTFAPPEEWEIDEFLDSGKIFLGPQTTDGQSDGAYVIII
jgi:hypothetical protein